MKTVILAGGYGSRLAEETSIKPKPMVEIGGKPILLHIMSIYSRFGFKNFVIACGYMGHVIKEYFNELHIVQSDYTIDLTTGEKNILQPQNLDWTVSLFDTGLDTMTGGRVRRLSEQLSDETFLLTYGDGVADINIDELLSFHRSHGRLATVTAVRPPARFGSLDLDGNKVRTFGEKLPDSESWINGGFFVFEPGVFEYIAGDEISLEREPLAALASDGELMAYRHEGFWQPMDTLRDRKYLNELLETGDAPWIG
tara:strand:- start:999 stop:1763 length:765 start_codon:yes stop_codon:yes gene_type:complete